MTYKDVRRIRSNPTAKDVDNAELHRLIDEAIDKQIGREPRASHDGKAGFCPRCGAHLDFCENYCSVCGQKLDWGDEEEGEEVK